MDRESILTFYMQLLDSCQIPVRRFCGDDPGEYDLGLRQSLGLDPRMQLPRADDLCDHMIYDISDAFAWRYQLLRLTDEELARLQRRIKKAGIPQGEYLRNMALTGSIVVREEPPLNVELLDELALIRAELGRLGGLLKMIVRPNEGRRELSPKEWNELIAAIRWLEKVKKRMEEAERKLSGHRNT